MPSCLLHRGALQAARQPHGGPGDRNRGPEDIRERLADLKERIALVRSNLERINYTPGKGVMTADIMLGKIIALLSSGSRLGKRGGLNVLMERTVETTKGPVQGDSGHMGQNHPERGIVPVRTQ